MGKHLSMLCLIITVLSYRSLSQIEVGAEYLLINQSPEANAQGTSSVSRITDDAYAVNFNPAHLGFSSSESNLTYSLFSTKNQQLLGFSEGSTLNSYAVDGGVDLRRYLSVPISLGFAYSHTEINYGAVSSTLENSSSYDFKENNHGYSIGVGICYGVQIAIGFTVRKIESTKAYWNFRFDHGSLWSRDYGILVNIPVTELFMKNTFITPNIMPLGGVSVGTALTNVGEKIIYSDEKGYNYQAFPIPRTIALGTTLNLGITYAPTHHNLLFFSWSRESRDLLVGVDSLGIGYYRGGFGNIDFFKNVIGGKRTTQAINGVSYAVTDLAQGWQFNIGEFLYIRGGSFNGTSNVSYTTQGIGVRLSGFLKLVDDFSPQESNALAFLRDHVDIRYDHSSYSSSTSMLDDTKSSSWSFIVKL